MKSRNLLLLSVCCFATFCADAQNEILGSEINGITINCRDSLGDITSLGGTPQAYEFYFHKIEETLDMFYVENFNHPDFYNLTFKNDKDKIKSVKLVRENYVASVHDFLYCYNKDNQKDRQEEKQLAP